MPVTSSSLMSKQLKVHIVGTHGVPARYGGFETLADFLCQHLAAEFEITVYCTADKYPVKTLTYHEANLRYVNIQAHGFKGIFYDLVTYLMAIPKADVILYLSPVGSGFMTPLKYLAGRKIRVLVNHGGLNEWEREKLTWIQRKWAKFNHRVASAFSDVNIVDNQLYRASLQKNFDADAVVIRYGGDHVKRLSVGDKSLVSKYPFVLAPYAASVVRAQMDNNIHIMLQAFEKFDRYKLVVVSNWDVSAYGRELKERYKAHRNLILLDAIYDKDELDFIRGNGYLYIHSHSRCGTAPSLVEAMCLGQAVVSFDVPTNRETTKGEAFYFQDTASLVSLLDNINDEQIDGNRLAMQRIAMMEYRWEDISGKYRDLIASR